MISLISPFDELDKKVLHITVCVAKDFVLPRVEGQFITQSEVIFICIDHGY